MQLNSLDRDISEVGMENERRILDESNVLEFLSDENMFLNIIVYNLD